MRHPISGHRQTIARVTRASTPSPLRSAAKWLAAAGLYYSGLYFLYARFRDSWLGPRAVIVMYHRIRSAPRPAALTRFEKGVALDRFRQHVRALAALGPLRTVRASWAALSAPGSRSSVAVTFDDAYRDILPAVQYLLQNGHTCTVYPVLAASKHGIPLWWDRLYQSIRRLTNPGEAVQYPPTEENSQHGDWASAGESPYLDLDELRRLAAKGVEIGGHTTTHPFLGRLGYDRIREEIEQTRQFLRREVCNWPVSFAYPHGSWSEVARQVVLDAGFSCAVTTEPGVADRADDAGLLPRVPADDEPAAILALRIVLADLKKAWHVYCRAGCVSGRRRVFPHETAPNRGGSSNRC